MEDRPQEPKLRPVPFAAHAARGLIRDPRARRWTMLGVVVLALMMAVAGATVLRELLNPGQHLLRFVAFWSACAWLTILSVLLAMFDLLMLRAQKRAAHRALREQLK
ncbi:MAG: hypothetical protein ACR2NX_11365 [Chthoniobacterales bacterium]